MNPGAADGLLGLIDELKGRIDTLEANANLQPLDSGIGAVEKRLAALEAKPPEPATRASDFLARAGQTVVIEAPGAGIKCSIVKATKFNRGETIQFIQRNPNPVTLRAIDGKVNGQPFVVSNATGTFFAVSDGQTGWLLDQGIGIAGVAGAPGTPGATTVFFGADGPEGPEGPQGFPGAPGSIGATGATGATGPRGFDGQDGTDGQDGFPGLKGDTGPTGATGPAGSGGSTLQPLLFDDPVQEPQDFFPGPVGATGAVGPVGPMGLQGEPGADGSDGAPGPQGVAGATGAQGPVSPFAMLTSDTAEEPNAMFVPQLRGAAPITLINGNIGLSSDPDSGLNVDSGVLVFRKMSGVHWMFEEFDFVAPQGTVTTSGAFINCGNSNWTALPVGASGSIGVAPAASIRPGQITLTTGATSGNQMNLWRGGNATDLWAQGQMLDRFRVDAKLTSAASVGFVFGFTDSASNAVAFAFDTTVGATVHVQCAAAGVTTDVDTLIAPGTAFRSYEAINVFGTGWQFYIDGALITTISTNVPSTQNLNYTIQTFTRTAATKTLTVDYTHYRLRSLRA